MPDPYELDDEGRPVAEDHSEEKPERVAGVEVTPDAPADPAAEEAAMQRQIETTLRFMRLQTFVGIIVILALFAFMSSIRGVLALVFIIFTFSSAGAYWWLKRSLNARLRGPAGGRQS